MGSLSAGVVERRASASHLTRWFALLTAALFVYVAATTLWGLLVPAAPTSYAWFEYPIVAVLFVGMAWLIASPRSPIWLLSTRLFLLAAFALFITSRVLWIVLVPTEPVNDFLVLHNLAGLLAAGNPIPRIADRGNWPIFMYAWGYCLVLGGVYALFGKAVIVGQLFNVVLGAATLWATFSFTRIIVNEKTARAVAVLFVAWPSQILWTNVIAAEHVALAAASVALYLLAITIAPVRGHNASARHNVVNIFIAGILLAVAYLSRFPLLILMIAVLMTLPIAAGFTRRAGLHAAALVIGFVLVNVAYQSTLTNIYQVNLPARSAAGNMLVGVNIEGGGGWNEGDWRKLISFPSMESASAWAMQESLQRLRERPLAIAGLMIRKVTTYWRNDDYGVLWAVERSVPPSWASRYLTPLYHAAFFFHVCVVLLATWGALVLAGVRARTSTAAPSRAMNLIFLPLLGGTALHSLLEVQSRYHYPFEPLLFVLAAIGAAALAGRAQPASAS